MSHECFKIVIVILSLSLCHYHYGVYVNRSKKNLEPAPVSFTLFVERNSKDLHTRCQDDNFLAFFEPTRSFAS